MMESNYTKRFLSLRTKLVIFISLVIVGVCSGLSWYLVQQQSDSMKNSLINTGFILVRNIAHNARYSLITQDTDSLQRFLEGALSVEEVVYAVATGPQGEPLVAKTKGQLSNSVHLFRSEQQPLFPDPTLAQHLLESTSDAPTVTVFTTKDQNVPIVSNRGKAGSIQTQITQRGETIYDFSLLVRPRVQNFSSLGPLSLEQEEMTIEPNESESSHQVYGVIQIGLTNAYMLQTLNTMIGNVVVITIAIILVGIASATLLANRIITPVRRLAAVAGQIANGDLSVSVNPEANDEVGQLTTSINQMTTSLRQREQAISTYVETITKQVSQLSTLNQTGVAITSTLDVDKLLSMVLKLLVENLGYVRMVLVFYEPDEQMAIVSQVTGVPKEMEEKAKSIHIPILHHTGLEAQLLIHGKPVLAQDIEMVADRMYPGALQVCRDVGVSSFVAAPLKSQNKTLGFLGADRGSQACAQEDLDVLMTIANHVSIAIDHARSYQELENLNQTLEERVQDRTKALQRVNERLQEHDRLKTMFVSNVSHELRTPMTSMKGLVENMLDGLTGTLSDRQSFYLNRVKHNIDRLMRMINELLDLSRIEAGSMQLRRAPLSVIDLSNEAVDILRPSAKQKSLTLEVRMESGIPEIMGDRDKLLQVLTNLINNAVKFTQPGGEIKLEGRLGKDDSVEMCVSDTGCGIPPPEIHNIFERFYRGDSVAVEARGAGLGLAISKSLVELHGGRIWVESWPNQGSRFFFTLPTKT